MLRLSGAPRASAAACAAWQLVSSCLWSPHLEALFKELPPELDALAELTRLQDLQAGFPALGALVANDKKYKDPRHCVGWEGCTSQHKYGRVVSYRLRVDARLEQLIDPGNWSAIESSFMEDEANLYRNYNWESTAFDIGMTREAYGWPSRILRELLEAQDTITPALCAEAALTVIARDFMAGKKRDYQLMLVAGLIRTYESVPSIAHVLAEMIMDLTTL